MWLYRFHPKTCRRPQARAERLGRGGDQATPGRRTHPDKSVVQAKLAHSGALVCTRGRLQYTGARRGEVCGIKWSDVNLNAKSVTIRRSLADTKSAGRFFKEPKNGKARTIALPGPLVSILENHRVAQQRERGALGQGYVDCDLVFARPDGSFVSPWCYTAAVKRLGERAKLKSFSLHDLRDTHASPLARKGVPLEVVSKRLGHSSIGVTAERYLHVYAHRDAAAASVLDTLYV